MRIGKSFKKIKIFQKKLFVLFENKKQYKIL